MFETTPLKDGGMVLYDPSFLEEAEADGLLALLVASVPWKQETARGRRFPRLTAWYADAGLSYSYSGVTHEPLPWLPELLEIKRRIESTALCEFNSLLLNLYRDGNDSMGMHADAEPELGINPVIGSLSLGAVRRFLMQHTGSGERRTWELAHGSLLVMAGATQHHWRHGVPKVKRGMSPRVNLTFRRICTAASSKGL